MTKDSLRWPAPLTKSELWFVHRPWRINTIPNLASSQERRANARSGGHLMPFPTMHMKGQKESKLLNSRAQWTGIMGMCPDSFGAKGRQRKKEKAGHCFSLLWVPLLRPDTAGQWVSNFVHQNCPECFEKITFTKLVSLEAESRNQHFQNKFPRVILGSRFKHKSHSWYRKEGVMWETERYPQISAVEK